jgi:hypothetical protein
VMKNETAALAGGRAVVADDLSCGGLQLVVAYDSGDVRASGRLEPGLQILLLSRDFTNRADRGENPSPV